MGVGDGEGQITVKSGGEERERRSGGGGRREDSCNGEVTGLAFVSCLASLPFVRR